MYENQGKGGGEIAIDLRTNSDSALVEPSMYTHNL